nr:MAG TPA: hypothetical protein [Caudoviricetes sp.]
MVTLFLYQKYSLPVSETTGCGCPYPEKRRVYG